MAEELDALIEHLEKAQRGFVEFTDQLERTTDALETAIAAWSGAARSQADQLIEENRDLINQIRSSQT